MPHYYEERNYLFYWYFSWAWQRKNYHTESRHSWWRSRVTEILVVLLNCSVKQEQWAAILCFSRYDTFLCTCIWVCWMSRYFFLGFVLHSIFKSSVKVCYSCEQHKNIFSAVCSISLKKVESPDHQRGRFVQEGAAVCELTGDSEAMTSNTSSVCFLGKHTLIWYASYLVTVKTIPCNLLAT